MIVIRRVLAVLLGIIFLGVFIGAVVTSTLSAKALNPRFYADALAETDSYVFLYDQALPYALGQWAADAKDPVLDVATLKKESVEAMRKVLPPEWLQARVQEALFQLLPYAAGDSDHFTLTLDVNNRVPLAAEEAKRLLKSGATFDALYNEITARMADQVVEKKGELPAGVTLQRDDVLKAIRVIAPKAWLAVQMSIAIDATTPWVQGKAEHFTVRIAVGERAEVAGQELKALLRKSDAGTLVRQEMLDPLIEQTVRSQTELSYDLRVTQAEARQALTQALTDSWAQARVDGLVDALVAYLTSKTQAFSLSVPLVDRREAVFQVIVQLADRKLEAAFNALPQCSQKEFALAIATLAPNQLSRCRPAGASYPEVKRQLGIDLVPIVRQSFGSWIPDAWVFGESELRAMLGDDAWNNVQTVRRWMTDGYVYTDADLRKELDAGSEATLDRVLRFTRQGGTFTESDLRAELAKGSDGQQAVENLDTVRNVLQTWRRTRWLNWVAVAVALIGIGFLGGRSWGTRLAWAGGSLTVVAVLWLPASYILSGALVDSRGWVEAAMESSDPAVAPLVDWEARLGERLVSGIAGAMRLRIIVALVVGVAMLAAGIWLHARSQRPVVAQAAPPGPSTG
ncbi:MAG: hypothetical protein EXR47_07175 [Dehalococcoidia bacterium]|nr:hypothetical protein [Dehalococcoidia bacterium]